MLRILFSLLSVKSIFLWFYRIVRLEGINKYAIKEERKAVKLILKTFNYSKSSKFLQNDPDTVGIFSQPPLISFKRYKNIGNFLVRSVFQTSEQPGTFKCARARCKTCPFIGKVEKISGPKRSIKITDHFTCTSASVIYCITCTLCKSYTSAKQGDD